jgi:hypothetical protein
MYYFLPQGKLNRCGWFVLNRFGIRRKSGIVPLFADAD